MLDIRSLDDEQYVLHQNTEETVVKPLDSAQSDLEYTLCGLEDLKGCTLAADREHIENLLDSISHLVTRVRGTLAVVNDAS